MTTITIKQGTLKVPGSSLESKRVVEELLAKDHDEHHCFFRPNRFHNHLSHHILAAYDLGASAELLKAIYEEEAKIQRPIMLDEEGVLKPGEITQANWTKHMGDQKAYAAYNHFFKGEAKSLGAAEVVEKYIFSSEANESGVGMLIRLVRGATHPFIQLGYTAEFGNDVNLIGSALAQTAVHVFNETGTEVFKYVPSEKKIPLLQVISEFLKNPILEPVMPYKPDALFFERIQDALAPPSKRGQELAKVCSMWNLPDEPTPSDLDHAFEEAIWAVTLLFAGTSKAGHKPRLDFFIMHALTSSIFIRPLCSNLVKKPENQAKLLRHWFTVVMAMCLVRGRPQINGEVLMGYTEKPLPLNYDNVVPIPDKSAITPHAASREGVNPWTFIVQSCLRAPDSHTPKSLRTLLYGAINFGSIGPGGAPGALDENGREVIPGLKSVDGTIFARAAGVMMDTLGWVDWGQPEGSWDRSALGWDDAWKNEG